MASTMTPVTGIDATYYTVKDLERATKFYSELLGASPTMVMPGMVSEWTFAGGESFGLYQPPEGEGEFHPSGGVMFAVADVAVTVESAKANGVTFHGAIEETPNCHLAFGQDTEGNGFILHHRK